jgi:hypothetical protein
MNLDEEIKNARKEIVSDGYDMSIGEVINLYRDNELIINPEFQRLFRWDLTRKTRFIESLLLGIPVPPIFVFQDENGVWELIDGLQRLSTIFEFAGLLHDADGVAVVPSTMEGTNFLPSLANKRWEPTDTEANDGIGKTLQLQIKRARIRVEILQKESDPQAKYELFQRLNTGGARLSEQEVRNCVIVMLNPPFYQWLIERASSQDFVETTNQTEAALQRQGGVELAVRFIAFRNVSYEPGLDVHEYLDKSIVRLANDPEFGMDSERDVFDRTFSLLNEALGSNAFKRWDGNHFRGKFLMSVFEVVATGVAFRIDEIEKLDRPDQKALVERKAKDLWASQIFQQNSGAGVRGTTRLTHLLPFAVDFFRP